MKHDWVSLGGSGRWEVLQCSRCHRWVVPNIFGGVNWMRWVWPRRFSCPTRSSSLAPRYEAQFTTGRES